MSLLLAGGRPPANSFVVWDRRLVYVSVTKSACTTLRWMVADLAGEDLDSFHRSTGAQQSRLMTIHGSREKWRNTVRLTELPPERLAEIDPENGWFVFAVVRDPWSRFWSTWQSKFLVRHWSHERFRAQPWYPAEPTSADGVVRDFRAFVEARPWTTDPLLRDDVHLKPQVHSVHPADVNYTEVYDLRDLGRLFEDLTAHLAAVGRPAEHGLYVPRANENPLPLIPAVLEGGTAERLEEIYAADFAEFGDRWSLDEVRSTGTTWSDDALRHAAAHTVANQRIADLSRQARRFERRWQRASRRGRRLRREVEALRAASPGR